MLPNPSDYYFPQQVGGYTNLKSYSLFPCIQMYLCWVVGLSVPMDTHHMHLVILSLLFWIQ